MIKSTKELIEYLNQSDTRIDYTIVSTYTHTIIKCGSKTDANVLLDYFISNPIEFYSDYFFGIFKKWGDSNYAEKIFNAHFNNGELINSDYPEILELLSALKFMPIKPTLIHYGFSDNYGYYINKSALLGLLHFDCSDIETLIKKEIEKTINQDFFSEFIPALICKIPNNEKLLKQLFKTGKEYCSSDSNSGIILGISLCGKNSEVYFWDIIFNSFWEANGVGTGNSQFVYMGINNLKITLTNIYKKILRNKNSLEQENGLKVLFALIEIRIYDGYTEAKLESYSEIYQNLYAWENENRSNNIIDLAMNFELKEEAYRLERVLKLKMKEEVILQNINN